MLLASSNSTNEKMPRSKIEAEVKLDMKLGINMDSYGNLALEEQMSMCKMRAKLYARPRKTLSPRKFLLKKELIKKKAENGGSSRRRHSLA